MSNVNAASRAGTRSRLILTSLLAGVSLLTGLLPAAWAAPSDPPVLVRTWGGSGAGEGQFDFPYGIAVGGASDVYVADTGNHRIQRFTAEGEFVGQWGGTDLLPAPVAVATDGTGYVYVVDYYLGVLKFTASGASVASWGSHGSAEGQLSGALGIAVAPDGSVYVADSDNDRVQKFTSSGVFLAGWGSAGSADGQFSSPSGIAVDTSGKVYVVDTFNNRVQKFTSSGGFLARWNVEGDLDGGTVVPHGAAVDAAGNLYVADAFSSRIQQFSITGTLVSTWTVPNGTTTTAPFGVAVDATGGIYVSDFHGHVQKFVARDSVIVNTVPPAIVGTPSVGAQVASTSGSWDPAPTTFAYQWVVDGTVIAGATASTYTPGPADAGRALTVWVQARKDGREPRWAPSASKVVQAGVVSNVELPTIAGAAEPGGTLTAAAGSWTPSGTSPTYQWLRNGGAISGATANSHTLVAGDVGTTVSVRVTASKAGFAPASATSSGVVVSEQGGLPMTALSQPKVSGTPRVGVRLSASPGTWNPAGSYAYQWQANGSAISGATGSTYTPTAGVRGMRISVRVTASKGGYATGTATSAQTGAVAAGILTNSAAPSVTGTRRVGHVLTANRGTWTPGGLTYRYQWFRGNTAIKGATARTLKLPASTRGHKIRVRVTAARAGYTSLARYSAYTVAIR